MLLIRFPLPDDRASEYAGPDVAVTRVREARVGNSLGTTVRRVLYEEWPQDTALRLRADTPITFEGKGNSSWSGVHPTGASEKITQSKLILSVSCGIVYAVVIRTSVALGGSLQTSFSALNTHMGR
jgi:hypothetical protein